MQISIRTCISKYHISVAPFKTQVQGTVDALAIQNEEEEICVRDESSRLKDIDLSLLWLELGLREEEFPEGTGDLKEYLITKLLFNV